MARALARRALERAQGAPACRRALRRLRPPLTVAPATPADRAAVERLVGRREGPTAVAVPAGGRVVTAGGVTVEPRGWLARLRLPWRRGGTPSGGARGPVVGYVELIRLVRPEGGEEWWLQALAVRRPLRGAGIGTLLVERVLDEARAAGAAAVSLRVAAANTAALALYAKLGFERVAAAPVPGAAATVTLTRRLRP